MADVYLPADSQRRLIQIARQTLEDFVCGRGGRRLDIDDPYLKAADYGAFVTLFKENELRGCICNPSGPLRYTVVEMTEAAASRDSLIAGQASTACLSLARASAAYSCPRLLPSVNGT